jgi:HD-like signal output (HDOD) protein
VAQASSLKLPPDRVDTSETMAETAEPVAAGLALALPDLSAWTKRFLRQEVPVLSETAALLESLRAKEDEVDAHLLAEAIYGDPLMTLKVLAHAGTHRPSRVLTEVETVTAALLLMGISPFFRTFGPQATIETHLARHPTGLDGLQAVLRRSHRAARFALAFAVHRMDDDAAVIHQAALLHDLAEMLMWCHAPQLAFRIAEHQRMRPALRSTQAQREVLNIALPDLQMALTRAWGLPQLLVRVADWRHALCAPVRNVLLAVRLARHTAHGWDNPAVPDDLHDIGELLNLRPHATLQLVQEVDS